jgi:hypothetical protein
MTRVYGSSFVINNSVRWRPESKNLQLP